MDGAGSRKRGRPRPGCRPVAYSKSIAAAVTGIPRRGIVHSVFNAAATIAFPRGFALSLNALSSPRMPNGLQLSAAAGAFPFSDLRAGMPALLGAQRLHIEAIGCSLDLSFCPQWDPHIQRPAEIPMEVVLRNSERLIRALLPGALPPYTFPSPGDMARFFCGRGVGLTPAGDDILAGWMSIGWLLYGPEPWFLEACSQVVEVAERQTHLLSRTWLRSAAEGNFALPVVALLNAIAGEDTARLDSAAEAVLALGATSGRDLIQGILLGLQMKR